MQGLPCQYQQAFLLLQDRNGGSQVRAPRLVVMQQQRLVPLRSQERTEPLRLTSRLQRQQSVLVRT